MMFGKGLESGVKSEVTINKSEVGGNFENNIPTNAEFKKKVFDALMKGFETEKDNLSGSEILNKISYSNLEDKANNPDDKPKLEKLCSKIRENMDRDDKIEAKNELYPKYQKLMADEGYSSVSDFCNEEGLDYDDVYDNESKTYGEEYKRGFIDGYNGEDNDSDSSEAYVQGVIDSQELRNLINKDPEQSVEKEFNDLSSMKNELGKTYAEIKEIKPLNSPDIEKWFNEGGKISITEKDGKPIFKYTDAEGKTVEYVDGNIKFPPEARHPVINDINIGNFTGDRNKDKQIYLEKLEEEYGLTDIPNGYSLHHDTENGVMQLIKDDYHKEFTHAGGYSKYKENE